MKSYLPLLILLSLFCIQCSRNNNKAKVNNIEIDTSSNYSEILIQKDTSNSKKPDPKSLLQQLNSSLKDRKKNLSIEEYLKIVRKTESTIWALDTPNIAYYNNTIKEAALINNYINEFVSVEIKNLEKVYKNEEINKIILELSIINNTEYPIYELKFDIIVKHILSDEEIGRVPLSVSKTIIDSLTVNYEINKNKDSNYSFGNFQYYDNPTKFTYTMSRFGDTDISVNQIEFCNIKKNKNCNKIIKKSNYITKLYDSMQTANRKTSIDSICTPFYLSYSDYFHKTKSTLWDTTIAKYFYNSKEGLEYEIYRILAKRGYIFKSQKLRNLFSFKEWYCPKYYNIDTIEFSKTEISEIVKLRDLLKNYSTFELKKSEYLKNLPTNHYFPDYFQYLYFGTIEDVHDENNFGLCNIEYKQENNNFLFLIIKCEYTIEKEPMRWDIFHISYALTLDHSGKLIDKLGTERHERLWATDSNKIHFIELPPDPGPEGHADILYGLTPGEKDSIPTHTYEITIDKNGKFGYRELIKTEWEIFEGMEIQEY